MKGKLLLIRMFLKHVIRDKKIPFSLASVPKQETGRRIHFNEKGLAVMKAAELDEIEKDLFDLKDE